MKNFLLTWMTMACVATGVEKVTLDTEIVSPEGEASSLWMDQSSVSPSSRGGINSRCQYEKEIKFYVKISELHGAEKLNSGATYKLDSLAWYGAPGGDLTGPERKVTISNGEREVTTSLPVSSNEKVMVRMRKKKASFTFTRDDILEVTLGMKEGENGVVAIRFFDAPVAPGEINGVAFSLDEEGELLEGDASKNKYCIYWRYNCPAIRIRATEIEDNKQLLLLGGGAGGLLLLVLLLAAMRRKKK